MYLQDREPGRTPRWRGVTPARSCGQQGSPLQRRATTVATRFAYGDHDMLDTWRQSVRILHLDHPYGDAAALAGPEPARIMGIEAGIIGVGRPADLMILEAWSIDQVIARPHADRLILRRGVFANRTLPSYSLLGGQISQ